MAETNTFFTHYFDVFMRSIKNLGFYEANFEIVNPQLLYPHSHGVLGSLRNLVNSSYKYAWRSQETLGYKQKKKGKRVKYIYLQIKGKKEVKVII